jgi:hypothetical protein
MLQIAKRDRSLIDFVMRSNRKQYDMLSIVELSKLKQDSQIASGTACQFPSSEPLNLCILSRRSNAPAEYNSSVIAKSLVLSGFFIKWRRAARINVFVRITSSLSRKLVDGFS